MRFQWLLQVTGEQTTSENKPTRIKYILQQPLSSIMGNAVTIYMTAGNF
jgi:hypothetical protein